MNERIQELINQSWQNVEGAPRAGMEDIRQALMEELNPVFLEFARLMVQECAATAWWAEQYDMGDGKPISKQITEHFGVEE